MKKDFIILLTTSDGQYDITKRCLESFNSKHNNFDVYMLNYGESDPKMKKLGKQVAHYKDFPDGTPITVEMNYGINLAKDKTDLVVNANNDIVVHPKTCDFMIDTFKNSDIKSLSGHITTSLDEIKDYDLNDIGDLFYRGNFVSHNKFGCWLNILNVDFGFDLYSFNWWHTDYFKRVGMVDEITFNKGIYLWDTDYQYRGALAGIDTYVASSAVYFHECGYTYREAKDKSSRDLLYTAMKDAYYEKWGGEVKNSKYIGSQHNESFTIPFQERLSREELWESGTKHK